MSTSSDCDEVTSETHSYERSLSSLTPETDIIMESRAASPILNNSDEIQNPVDLSETSTDLVEEEGTIKSLVHKYASPEICVNSEEITTFSNTGVGNSTEAQSSIRAPLGSTDDEHELDLISSDTEMSTRIEPHRDSHTPITQKHRRSASPEITFLFIHQSTRVQPHKRIRKSGSQSSTTTNQEAGLVPL